MVKGVISTDTILDRILSQTADDVGFRRQRVSEAQLQMKIRNVGRKPLSLADHLQSEHVALIAEIKRGSPSRGVFPAKVEPTQLASDYRHGGASATSCLTDGPFFHGSLKDLEEVADSAHAADDPIPVLQKDFVVDPYQVLEARAHGADAILLIVGALDDVLLAKLFDTAMGLGLSALVEVHSEREMERALHINPTVVGINNRDLRSFEVDLAVTERLATMVPPRVRLVSESGIFSAEDVLRVSAAGADAILVGESLILQADRKAAVQALSAVPRNQRA